MRGSAVKLRPCAELSFSSKEVLSKYFKNIIVKRSQIMGPAPVLIQLEVFAVKERCGAWTGKNVNSRRPEKEELLKATPGRPSEDPSDQRWPAGWLTHSVTPTAVIMIGEGVCMRPRAVYETICLSLILSSLATLTFCVVSLQGMR